ncbi:polyphosphate polymerase domain-containing protein [Clostridium sp. Marseille-P2415]|uniref:polyphosphate polymerase domain-containing protein n=1 Tax=Clostridium sp. Marseille-P2415 TaxID=1805471 RepID=UPI00098877B0|nr:polyphosphate polymerase domain-containing protein [Clostridium sp. Marseille-P2415]
MSGYQMTFERFEIKYLLDPVQVRELKKKLEGKMVTDRYGKSVICNIYFDTPDSRLIRESLEKPVYKEKLRLRSYGMPKEDGSVFLELKKKYKGIVYKRREVMSLAEAEEYLYRRGRLERDSQVLHEIDWFLDYYKQVVPAMYISYDRTAMYGVEEEALRLTLDGNILWRDEELSLDQGSWGQPLLETGWCLMEIKIAGAMPVWLGHILDELRIYPASFSKYGRAYERQTKMKLQNKGGENCA